ncbi:MAG: hypothetical protein M1828_005731 [Chrysothrix sp. TS-e1954]|nr:MAG: hypothetical protein M1828_005731 [Chrysothrix sp. TS-e1954]
MLPQSRTRLPHLLTRVRQPTTIISLQARRTIIDNPAPVNNPDPKPRAPNVSETNAMPTSSTGSFDRTLQEDPQEAEQKRVMQAPNRAETWAAHQRPRSEAMVGPRFEQAIMEDQPRPLSAMELIHKQPVRWTHSKQVSCDGGGGPLGHPRIFINVQKPQICMCTYCGVPFANEQHRPFLESLPSTTYPLEPSKTPDQIGSEQSITGRPFEQR